MTSSLVFWILSNKMIINLFDEMKIFGLEKDYQHSLNQYLVNISC